MNTQGFRLSGVQVVAFTPDPSVFKTSSVLTPILYKSQQKYDGEVKTSPVASVEVHGVKREITTVELTSDDGQWKLTATPERIDSNWTFVSGVEGNKAIEKRGVTNLSIACAQPILHYLDDSGVQIGRLSLILNRWKPVADPARKLAEAFCDEAMWQDSNKNAPLRHSRNFQLHNHKRYRLTECGVDVNSWVRCISGTFGNSTAVTVVQDINTPQEELHSKAFTRDDVINFYESASSEAESILKLYFPDDTNSP